MKSLKIQLFENLINNGINAIYDKSDDPTLDDSIYYKNFDIQVSRNYVIVWKIKGKLTYMLWENRLSKLNINLVSRYISDLIKSQQS